MAKKIDIPQSSRQLPLAIVKQMVTLSTSGFGLVAALAWNEVVKEFVESFVKPYLPAGSKLVSLFIYAIIVTSLAVFVTLQLARLQERLTFIQEKLEPKKKTS